MVWKLDRLGRSLSHLVAVLSDLQKRGVAFLSLTEAIDTESAAGRLMGHILGALAEFERSLIVERTQAGLKAAKQRGQKLGRKRSLSDDQREHARTLITKGESPAAVAKLLNVCGTGGRLWKRVMPLALSSNLAVWHCPWTSRSHVWNPQKPPDGAII